MTNAEIKSKLKLTSKLMELHGGNPFKTRVYQAAADTIGDLGKELNMLSADEVPQIDGDRQRHGSKPNPVARSGIV